MRIISEHLNKEARKNYSEKVKYRIRSGMTLIHFQNIKKKLLYWLILTLICFISVIFHKGILLGAGHYIVNVFKNDEWICLNDETFKNVKEKEALRSVRNMMPYILFYELCAEDETESDVEEEDEDEEEPYDFGRQMRESKRKIQSRYDDPYMWNMYGRRKSRNIFELLPDCNDRDDVSGEESDPENEFRRSSKFDRKRLNMHYDREMSWKMAGRRSAKPPNLRDFDYNLRSNYITLGEDCEKRLKKRNAKMKNLD